MLIAPTEPPSLRAIGQTSLIPEKYGADVLIPTKHFGLVGVQRKEVNDLLASVQDDRLLKELVQMQQLGQGILLVEGRLLWTTDGYLMTSSRQEWTQPQFRGLMWSIASRGYWTVFTESLTDTIECVLQLTKWLDKDRHNSLLTRRGAKSIWGRPNNREWGMYVLQSFAGVGVDVAGKIYDHFGGVPLQWTVTEEELLEIRGIGKSRAKELMKSLKAPNPTSPSVLPKDSLQNEKKAMESSSDASTQSSSTSRTVANTSRSRRRRPLSSIEVGEIVNMTDVVDIAEGRGTGKRK